MANLPKITECFRDGGRLTYKQDGKHMPSIGWFEFLAWGDHMKFQLRQWDTFGQLLRATFVGMFLRDLAKKESYYMDQHLRQLNSPEAMQEREY